MDRRKAVALVLVIAFIVLISALVVSFFSRVTTDLSSSRSYAEGINVRQLADNAVGVVMGQIRTATTVPNGCWASQPGMIRVYGAAGGKAGPGAYAFYKLYSSQDLIVSGTEINRFDPSLTNPATSAVPVEVPLGTGGWMQQPAYFTDLNQPVSIPDPKGGPTPVKRYPIFDPSVALIYNPGSRPAVPAWKNPGGIEGCEIALAATDRTLNDAPMPVRWIYVLKDGTLTTPTPINGTASGTTGLVANWAAVGSDGASVTGVPTQANPIVGRIAFWTDDESCKVNLNTAGGFIADETKFNNYASSPMYANGSAATTDPNPAFNAGSFWDTPRVQTWFDRGVNSNLPAAFRPGLSNAQPQQNEFQRYPGHPATTSLGLVFQYLLPSNTGFNSEKLYALTPRLNPGGSQSGTRRLDTKIFGALAVKGAYNPSITGANGNHLYASLDEFYYTTQNALMGANGLRTSIVDGINAWIPGFNSDPNNASDIFFVPQKPMVAGSVTPQMVDQTRFCVTANNRSPELNLFGRPRVTMWPVPTATREQILQTYGIRNVSDDFIRFCSTIGGNPNSAVQTLTRQGEFIFDRQDPYSPSTDFAMARNQQIFNYLHGLTTAQVPGFGGSFAQKYSGGPGGIDQILVEIFDYIRTINQKDASRDKTIDLKTPVNTPANNQLKTAARYAPHALVVPTRATFNGTQVSGLGRYPTVSEASLVFYHAGYICEPLPGSDLAKKDLPNNGSARSPKSPNEVVIYDLAKIPVAPSYTDANSMLKSAWAKANVKTWKGQLVRSFMIFATFNPMQGYAPVDNFANISLVDTTPAHVNPDSGLMPRYSYPDPNKGVYVHQLQINGAFTLQTATTGGAIPLGIGAGASTGLLTNTFTKTSGDTWGGRNFGGTEGFYHTMIDDIGPTPASTKWPYYVFQSPCTDPVMDGVRVGWTDTSFSFNGGEMDLYVKYQDKAGHDVQIQKLSLTYPGAGKWPLPTPTYRQDTGGFDNRVGGFDADTADSWTRWSTFVSKYGMMGGWAMPYFLPARIAWVQQNSWNPWPKFDWQGNQVGDNYHYNNRYLQILQPGDTIRSLIVGGGVPASSDVRITALQQTVSTLQPHPEYQSATKHLVQKLRIGYGGFYFDPTVYAELPETTASPATGAFFPLAGSKYSPSYGPDLPPYTDAAGTKPFVAVRSDGGAADFDTGIGNFPDGAFAGKADEGNVAQYWWNQWNNTYSFVEPYFSTWLYDSPLDTYFSPNRQVPGPVMFGSLPAPQVPWAQAGWTTLLFCPNPAGANHPGAKTPPDHLLLDLFNMPVVQPYAISEPFSTAGKVNLNYPIVPFSYLKRTTALRAALQPLRVTAIPQTLVDGNKQFKYKGTDNQQNLRYLVDREQTLSAFDAFFAQYANNRSGGFFKCASQICERYLYPKGQTFDGSTVAYTTGEGQIQSFWARNQLTGDNVREKPYADLYPRITTKSNTFTVHYRVQTLRQRAYTGNPMGAAAYYRTFDESRDQILSELRGQTTIERYLDPQDPRFQSSYQPASSQINAQTQSLETAYRFRIVANKRFSPW